MTDDEEDLARLVAMGDQLEASAEQRRARLFEEFVTGPPADQEGVEPLALWVEEDVWCAVLRAPTGHLCGYARLPDGHPWVGLHYDDQVPTPPARLDREQPVEQTFDDHGVMPVFAAMLGGDDAIDEFAGSLAAAVSVHGGVTWTGPMPVRGAPHGWWIGFDCGHAGDAVDEATWRAEHPWADEWQVALFCHGGHVWTVDEVQLEVKRMVPVILATLPSVPAPRDGWTP